MINRRSSESEKQKANYDKQMKSFEETKKSVDANLIVIDEAQTSGKVKDESKYQIDVLNSNV